jgi:hypothetical protein
MEEQRLRSKADKRALQSKKLSINLRDIKDRALQKTTQKPFDKIEIRHVMSKRRTASRFEKMTHF